MSQGDLEELRKIARLATNERVTLHISSQIKDEFELNREAVIRQSLAQFEKSDFQLHRPNIVRVHSESTELEQLQSRFRELTKSLSARIIQEGRDRETTADKVISELFNSTSISIVSEEVITRGLRRVDLGRPPGKKDSCGDAIHWEWLLETVPAFQDLHVISRDGDFESSIEDGALSRYLADEWARKKVSTCILHCKLEEFLKAHFPDVRLADEIDKLAAIEKLENSPNFATTHNAIERLMTFDDYSREEVLRLISAYQTNNQINWILGDDDVKQFAHKIVTLAHARSLNDKASPIEKLLNDLEVSAAI